MKNKLLIIITLLVLTPSLKSQGIYDSLSVNDFRKYKPFKVKINPKAFNAELLNAAVFFATNEIRKQHKLNMLTYNPLLEKSATIHSTDMANIGFFDHTNPKIKKHKEPEDRATVAGIQNPHLAENIVEGFILEYTSGDKVIADSPGVFYRENNTLPIQSRTYLELADELLRIWMNSDGHRANILAKDAVELGCGSAFYVMREFNDMPAVKATQNFQWFVPVIAE